MSDKLLYEQERAELAALIKDRKIQTWNYIVILDSANAVELEHMGYGGKTQAEAMQAFFKSASKHVQKMIEDFERKWPEIPR